MRGDTAASALISLEGVSKAFESGGLAVRALDGVHLAIEQGEFLSVAGPSGCGKSTLLALLGLLDTPTEGTIRFDGRDVSSLGADARTALRARKVGFIFQSFNLIGDLSVAENVALPLAYGGAPAAERARRTEAALARVGLSHRGSHHPGQLSGGQQQRVAVARAVAGEPLVLLADEPTGNLDSKNGEAVMELLAELHASGSTICMVTHDERYARYAERTIHLFDGRITEERGR